MGNLSRFNVFILSIIIILIFAFVTRAIGVDTIYVDTSGIDSIPGLDEVQRSKLKECILKHIQDNFDEAVGEEKVNITDDPNKKARANRRSSLEYKMGYKPPNPSVPNSKGKYRYGIWRKGTKDTSVYLRNFTERHGADYKDSNGNWDIYKRKDNFLFSKR